MWNKLIDIKPKINNRYFVCVRPHNEVLILDYNVEYNDFGYDFTYGQWESFSFDKNDITHWMEIKYPKPPIE